eukprot:scaffold41471_cov21-Tisochrysis_lutea.AAC.1
MLFELRPSPQVAPPTDSSGHAPAGAGRGDGGSGPDDVPGGGHSQRPEEEPNKQEGLYWVRCLPCSCDDMYKGCRSRRCVWHVSLRGHILCGHRRRQSGWPALLSLNA